MRDALETLDALHLRAEGLAEFVQRVPTHEHRVELLMVLDDARTALKQATARIHAFDVLGMTAPLDAARQRLDTLAASLQAE